MVVFFAGIVTVVVVVPPVVFLVAECGLVLLPVQVHVYPSLIVPKPSVRQIDPNQSKNNIAVSFKNIPVFFS